MNTPMMPNNQTNQINQAPAEQIQQQSNLNQITSDISQMKVNKLETPSFDLVPPSVAQEQKQMDKDNPYNEAIKNPYLTYEPPKKQNKGFF